MRACFSCGQDLSDLDQIGRRDTCSKCDADLHCCRNCEFYEPKAYNECREVQAERVLEKEDSNFCDYFCLNDKEKLKNGLDEVAEAKKKLEALFPKK
jgi:hypothetical protein